MVHIVTFADFIEVAFSNEQKAVNFVINDIVKNEVINAEAINATISELLNCGYCRYRGREYRYRVLIVR